MARFEEVIAGFDEVPDFVPYEATEFGEFHPCDKINKYLRDANQEACNSTAVEMMAKEYTALRLNAYQEGLEILDRVTDDEAELRDIDDWYMRTLFIDADKSDIAQKRQRLLRNRIFERRERIKTICRETNGIFTREMTARSQLPAYTRLEQRLSSHCNDCHTDIPQTVVSLPCFRRSQGRIERYTHD